MNGGLTECSTCGWDPCRCTWLKEQKAQQRVKDGKVVLESLWSATQLSGWRLFFVKLFWPDIREVVDDLRDFYRAAEE